MEGLHCKDCSTISESVKKSFLIIRLNFLVLYVSFLFSLCYCYCYCRCHCHIRQLFLLVFTAYVYIQTIITSSYNNIRSVLVVQRVLFVSTGETLYTRNFPVEKLNYRVNWANYWTYLHAHVFSVLLWHGCMPR